MNWKTFADRTLKVLASLKMAVLVIVVLAILTAVGTFVEAKYSDAVAAAKLVYKTPWMLGTLGFFAINLTAVLVDRWPWKRRHLSFIFAHIGILVLLLGSLITMKWGLDGSMRVAIGQSSRFVASPVTDLIVWTSFDGDRYTKLFEKEVDFFLDHPDQEPLQIATDSGELAVIDYRPYMLASRRVRESAQERAGAAIQFQVQNPNVNVTEWLLQEKKDGVATHDFGPAQFHLGKDPGRGSGRNEVFLNPEAGDIFKYVLYGKESEKPRMQGRIKVGETLETGWMGLQLRILQYLPRAEFTWDFKESERATEMTNAAIKISFQGKEHWLQRDDIVKLFTDQAVYIVTYGHRRIDIGFDVLLKKFEVGRYPGTMRAATYQSLVEVPGVGEALISMNEPLKHQGLTLYQASFQDGPDGQPVASVFSVNHDPGRWMKYLGSLILSVGVALLFYDRRKAARSAMAPKKWEESS